MGPAVKNKNQKTIKIFLISVVVTILIAVTWIFISYRHPSDKSDKPVSLTQDKASVSIAKVHQTSTRNGIKEWTLDADSARYVNEDKRAIFQDISLTFFLKNKTEVRLTADEGVLKTDSNDIELSGNVILKNENYRLKTENLCYDHLTRVFSSTVPVKITGTGFDLAADSASFDLDTNKTVFKGSVNGNFFGNVTL